MFIQICVILRSEATKDLLTLSKRMLRYAQHDDYL